MVEAARTHRRGVAAVWLATFIWAWGPILVKGSSLPGPTFAMLRLWAGVGVSFLAITVTRRRFTWMAFRACSAGGVLFAADIGLGFTAVKATNVADVALIGALAPVVIVLVSSWRLHEPISVRSWALVAASFFGIVLVAIASAGLPTWSLVGDVLALASVATWSTYWFFSRHVRERFDPIIYFACVMFAGALTMTPIALVADGVSSGVTPRDLAAVVAVAVLPGFVGHTLVIWSHRHVTSWLSAMITQVSPVITVLLGWLVLGEEIPPAAVLGGAIVVGATMAVIALDARRLRAPDLDEAAEKVS
jgi:drug/metabolite transporter (DMT)-like permease